MKRVLTILLASVLCLSGCTFSREKAKEKEAEQSATEAASPQDLLLDNTFYIQHKDEFLPLYIGQASFAPGTAGYQRADSSRVLWFMEDWENIPTLYEGDTLVYHNSVPFNETVYFERYEDLGYTFGLSGLSTTYTGRYQLGISDVGYQIDVDSNAYSLYGLNAPSVVFDKIGGVKLQSGAISRAGTILGLQKDLVYDIEAYVGTNIRRLKLKADARALVSMEGYQSADYDFLQSNIIRINIPEYFNSGYYFVNGQGLFRYVKGTSYNENTDFNVPNMTANMARDLTPGDGVLYNKDFLVVEEKGTYDIEVTYKGEITVDVQGATPVPKADLVFNDGNRLPFEEGENAKLSLSAYLESGTYTLDVYELFGRTYDVKISKHIESKENTEENNTAEEDTKADENTDANEDKKEESVEEKRAADESSQKEEP